MPCSNCHRHGHHCVIDLDISSSCSECIRRKVACDGGDISARLFNAMKESRRLEDEEDAVMKDFAELQSRLTRIREQRRHLRKRQKELFDRGMSDLSKEIRGESSNSNGESSGVINDEVVAGEGSDDWLRELESMSPGALERLAASVGQGSDGANPQSLS
ncbi:hypothetical protein SMAC4_13515 [Sordaria macrospora]|uniref:uncharacterized protein n=1 Tax=Sordaria macrospora TaxID=5147 RepID=UPI002B2C5515|nr:hypothetical protein SMAC4_13515 [Sordaria macrospora]